MDPSAGKAGSDVVDFINSAPSGVWTKSLKSFNDVSLSNNFEWKSFTI